MTTFPLDYTFEFSFDLVPSVMKRGRHALIVIKDENGDFVLGAKHIYPDGIYRLVGGGLEGDEDPLIGATRELNEEFGLAYTPDKLTPLARISATITETITNKVFTFVTYLFATTCDTKELDPSDDLDGMKAFTREEMKTLIDLYYHLPNEVVEFSKPKTQGSSEPFQWGNYGAFYGKVHEIAMKMA